MRPSQRVASRLVLWAVRRLVVVEGHCHLAQAREPAIFAFNHNNSFETVVVAAVLAAVRGGRVPHFMVDWMFVHLPVVGWLVRLCDPIPVYTKPARFRLLETVRRDGRRASPLTAALERLAAGADVGIFPESTRNPSPSQLLAARSGLGRLVLASGSTVVPVGLEFPAASRLGRVPLAGRLTVRIGAPISFAAERLSLLAEREGCGELDRPTARAFARAVGDRVMAAIAPLCGKAAPAHLQPEKRPCRPS